MSPATDALRLLARELDAQLVEVRRTLHRHPELAHQEVWTTAQIRTWLEQAGIPILPLPLKTGVVAEIRGAKPGPTVAIRTDIDALPVPEQTGLPFASEIEGKMHACGHDFHTATILGAALILQRFRDQFAGQVRVLFQPAEESTSGAIEVIRAGAMEGVQAIFGMHNKPDLPPGTVGIKAGPMMAATDFIEIHVEGKGGHAAIPDATVDPIVAGSAIVMALQTAVSRSVSPLDPVVVSIGSFRAGDAHNVIPGTAYLCGTVRTYDPEVRRQMQGYCRRIVESVAAGYGATARLNWQQGIPAVSNDAAMCDLMREAAESLGMPVVEAKPTMGGEDFAEYQQLAPGCFIWLGTGCNENWHHPKFMVDEAQIPNGAALFARVALNALSRLAAQG